MRLVIIEVYGNSGKNSQINEKLSQFRAEIVKSCFVKQVISGSKIKVLR
jgi:outer membrane protein OmpA-like peptidoglycan-associated protein